MNKHHLDFTRNKKFSPNNPTTITVTENKSPSTLIAVCVICHLINTCIALMFVTSTAGLFKPSLLLPVMSHTSTLKTIFLFRTSDSIISVSTLTSCNTNVSFVFENRGKLPSTTFTTLVRVPGKRKLGPSGCRTVLNFFFSFRMIPTHDAWEGSIKP